MFDASTWYIYILLHTLSYSALSGLMTIEIRWYLIKFKWNRYKMLCAIHNLVLWFMYLFMYRNFLRIARGLYDFLHQKMLNASYLPMRVISENYYQIWKICRLFVVNYFTHMENCSSNPLTMLRYFHMGYIFLIFKTYFQTKFMILITLGL